MKLDQLSKSVSRAVALAESARQSVRQQQALYAQAEQRLTATVSARNLAQATAQQIQEQAHSAIAKVVSKCLSAVFEDPYEFIIEFKKKRGRTEAKLWFERNGHRIDPMEASGGGAVDVAALALRLICLKLKKPKARLAVIMDEPFRNPSPHYRELVKKLIEVLSTEMGVQFIYATNILEIATGRIIDLDNIRSQEKLNHSGVYAQRRLRIRNRLGN